LDLCVIFIFFALVYTKKTNNQKHKAIIIKLSAGTPVCPSDTHVLRVVGRSETGRGRKAPHRTPEGSARALLQVSGDSMGQGERELSPELPWEEPKSI
jgi:hypothetical protein